MTDHTTKQLVDASALAGILGTSTAMVNGMDLPHYRVGRKGVRYDVDEVLRALRVECRHGANVHHNANLQERSA